MESVHEYEFVRELSERRGAILEYMRGPSAVFPGLPFVQEFKRDDVGLSAAIAAATEHLARVRNAQNECSTVRQQFDAAKAEHERSQKALASLYKPLGAAAFAALKAGEIPRQQEFADRIALDERITRLKKEQEALAAPSDAGIVSKAKAKALQLAFAAKIKAAQLSAGKLDAQIARRLIDSQSEDSVRSASTDEVLDDVASTKREIASCKQDLVLAADGLESAKAALSQALDLAHIEGDAAIAARISALENEVRSTQSRLRTRDQELLDMLVTNASSFVDSPIGAHLKRLADLRAEERAADQARNKPMKTKVAAAFTALFYDERHRPLLIKAAIICIVVAAVLLFARWSKNHKQDVFDKKLADQGLTEDEQQYVREARMIRDQIIEEFTRQLEVAKESQKGSVLPPPSHEEQEKEQEKIKRDAEDVVQHRFCRPLFWAGRPILIGTIANLDGEYRIDRIIGENEMICRLYGPKTPGESWNLVPLGENAVWLSGVPTKGHVDGERVQFSGLLAVRGTQRCRVHDDVYETYFRVEPAAVNFMRVNAALGAAAMADDQNPEMHERLNALRKLAALLPLKAEATKKQDVQDQQIPAQHAWSSAKGFWLSHSKNEDDAPVVVSLSQPSDAKNGGRPSLVGQDVANAVIGRNVERGEQVFAYDFKVEFIAPGSEQGTESTSRARGFWLVHATDGELLLISYAQQDLSPSYPLRLGNRRRKTSEIVTPVDGDFIKLVIGRNLTRGERAFVSEPKVESNR